MSLGDLRFKAMMMVGAVRFWHRRRLLLIVFFWTTVPRLLEWRRKRVFVATAERDAVAQKSSGVVEPYFLIARTMRSNAADTREQMECT
jgi:hypothetical protein